MGFVDGVPIPEYKSATLGIMDSPAIPGMDWAVCVLPGKMDWEENALAPCGCEKVNKLVRKPATPNDVMVELKILIKIVDTDYSFFSKTMK